MGKRGEERSVKRVDVLRIMRRQRPDQRKPWTTSDIADIIDVSKEVVRDRLGELYEQDLVDTRKVGARARVWWIPEGHDSAADDYLDAHE